MRVQGPWSPLEAPLLASSHRETQSEKPFSRTDVSWYRRRQCTLLLLSFRCAQCSPLNFSLRIHSEFHFVVAVSGLGNCAVQPVRHDGIRRWQRPGFWRFHLICRLFHLLGCLTVSQCPHTSGPSEAKQSGSQRCTSVFMSRETADTRTTRGNLVISCGCHVFLETNNTPA